MTREDRDYRANFTGLCPFVLFFLVPYVTTPWFSLTFICHVSSPCLIIYYSSMKGPVTSHGPPAHNNEINLSLFSNLLEGCLPHRPKQQCPQITEALYFFSFFISLHLLYGVKWLGKWKFNEENTRISDCSVHWNTRKGPILPWDNPGHVKVCVHIIIIINI